MDNQFPEISVNELFSKADFPSHVEGARQDAERIVERGSFVRELHSQGSINSSPIATSVGPCTIAGDLVDHLDEEKPEPFFGQHLRETIGFFRHFFKR